MIKELIEFGKKEDEFFVGILKEARVSYTNLFNNELETMQTVFEVCGSYGKYKIGGNLTNIKWRT